MKVTYRHVQSHPNFEPFVIFYIELQFSQRGTREINWECLRAGLGVL